jgi:geranylgeranyl diphosphate synthase type I
MFVLARLALGTLHRAISVQKCVQIVHTFDQATLALTEGQFLDLSFKNRLDVSVDEYLQMIRGKTAALVAASTAIGAQVASDNPQVTEAFARFGENLGLAFQMVDDILGVWGDPAVTGKSAASDILTKKKTLPIIRGLNTPGVSAELRALYAKDTLADTDLARVLTLLAYARAREFTRAKAEEFHRAALAALAETGLQNEAMQALRDLADAMVERKR